MLVLKRREGEWVEIDPRNGQPPLRVRTCNIGGGRVDLVFDDPTRSYDIDRVERKYKTAA